MSCGADEPYFKKGASSLRPRYCKAWVAGLHGRRSAKATRKTAIIITKVTENGADHARHFRLRENSRISNRELQIIESMRQRSHEVENWEVLASMVPAGPPAPPPEGGGAATLHIPDTTVTPKKALPKGVTGKILTILTGSRVGQLTGAMTAVLSMHRRLAGAPPLCIHETCRPHELSETG